MKIVSIETFTNEYVGLVRLRTDEGDEGWGQTSTYNSEITAQVLHLQVAPHVLGMSGHDISEVNSEVLDREHKFPGTYLYRALCGVDTALWVTSHLINHQKQIYNWKFNNNSLRPSITFLRH